MNSNQSRCPKWLIRIYRFCLYVYPKSFRDEFGAQLEQAFTDRYVERIKQKGAVAPLQFSMGILGDFSSSVCQQYWRNAQNAGFVRIRFLIILMLFASLLLIHESVTSKLTDGIYYLNNFNLQHVRDNAWHEEYEANRTRLSQKLRNSSDPTSHAAANLVYPQNNLNINDYPKGEALRQIQIRIAREVVTEPLKYSWFSKSYAYSQSDSTNLYEFLWFMDNIPEIRRCNEIGKEGGSDQSCLKTWAWMLEDRKFFEVMNQSSYKQPSPEQILNALESNQFAQLQRQYILINGLNTCQFNDARRFYNNISCPKKN